MKSLFSGLLLLACGTVCAQGAAAAQPAWLFTTSKFSITVTSTCTAENVNCDRVDYTGVRKSDGATLSLQGKALRDVCDNGECPVLSYWFKNGNATYLLDRVNNEFSVIIADKTVSHEKGSWHQVTAPAVSRPATPATRYFETPKFSIKISMLCPASAADCNNALYEGKRKSDGASVALPGKAVRIRCTQGNCPIDYYLFDNKKTGATYNLNVAGELLIVRIKDAVVMAEQGEWRYQ